MPDGTAQLPCHREEVKGQVRREQRSAIRQWTGLRWRRSGKNAIVAEYRFTDPVTKKRRGKTLGTLPTEAELADSEWLFPSATSKSGHIEDVRVPGTFSNWEDAEGNAVKFTPHGLRATFIGAGHAAGVSDRYVQLLANHALHRGDVHGGYVPEDDLPAMAAATQRITDYLRQHGLPV